MRKANNHKNLLSVIYKIIFLATPFLCIFVYFSLANYEMPIPLISKSISFDAKLHHYSKNNINQVEILAIGSSMTLNNLNSDVMVNKLKLKYYNFSSWGLQISDIHYLLKYYANKLLPRFVIICSNTTEFGPKGTIEPPTFNELRIYDMFNWYFYFKNPNIFKFAKQNIRYKKYLSDNSYTNLSFDRYGGAALNIPKENISLTRWNRQFDFPKDDSAAQYLELDQLAKFLNKNNIKLIFIQTPMRKGYLSDAKSNLLIGKHFTKCKDIVESNNGIYGNFHDTTIFDDSLFVDQLHLNEKGSVVFTKQVVNLINKKIYFK